MEQLRKCRDLPEAPKKAPKAPAPRKKIAAVELVEKEKKKRLDELTRTETYLENYQKQIATENQLKYTEAVKLVEKGRKKKKLNELTETYLEKYFIIPTPPALFPTIPHDRTQHRWPRDMFKHVKSDVPEDSTRSVPPPSRHAPDSRIVDVIELDDDEHVTVPVAPHLPTAPLISDDTGPAPPGPAALPTPAQPLTHPSIQMDAATFHHLRGVLAAFFPQFAQAPSPYITPHQGAVANHQFPPPVPSPYVNSAPGTSSYVAAAPGTVAIPQFPSNQMSFPIPPLGTVPVQQFPHHLSLHNTNPSSPFSNHTT